jgi:ATP-binding cassette subfamily B protein
MVLFQVTFWNINAMDIEKLERSTLRQLDEADCGVTCLNSILRYHGRETSIEQLRQWSGTTSSGTTLLGLLQAAEELGVKAGGYSAELEDLKASEHSCILHLLIDERLEHYMVYWGYDDAKEEYILGDPALGKLKRMKGSELASIWRSRKLLLVEIGNEVQEVTPLEEEITKTPSTGSPFAARLNNSKYAWFWHFIDADRSLLFTAMLLGLAVSVLGLSTALFSQQLIDQILPSRSLERLFAGVGVLFLLLAAKAGLSYIRSFFLIRQARDFNVRIIDYFFTSLMKLPKRFFDNRKTGDVVARMHDTVRIQRTISQVFANALIDAIFLVVALVATAFYDYRVALMMLAWLPLVAYVGYHYHQPIVEGQQNTMTSYAQAESSFIDSIQGIGVIKLFNRQELFTGAIKSVYQVFQNRAYDLGRTTIAFGFWIELISSLLISGILLLVSYLVLSESLTMGTVLALLQLGLLMMGAAGGLIMTTVQLREAEIAFDRMSEFTSLEQEPVSEGSQKVQIKTPPQEISIRNLSFGFRGRTSLLQNVNLSFFRGQLTVLLGKTGSGKSTFLQLLQKFYKDYTGAILVDNTPLFSIDTNDWRGHLGVVEQETKIFDSTVADNILMGDTVASVTVIEDFLSVHNLSEVMESFPNGLATIIGKNGVSPSGGQKQLIGLARALWRKPDFLLLDEPTASLDEDTERLVFDLLLSLRGRMGVFLLTHRRSLANEADKVYLLEAGQMKERPLITAN